MRKPLSSLERADMERIYPYYGAVSIVDYVDDFIFDGEYLLLSEDGIYVVDENGHPLLQHITGSFGQTITLIFSKGNPVSTKTVCICFWQIQIWLPLLLVQHSQKSIKLT